MKNHKIEPGFNMNYNKPRKGRSPGGIDMKRNYNVIIEQDEDGYYVGIVPKLPGCHTQAKSLDALRKRIKQAIELYLEIEKSAPKELNFIGIQKIEVQS